MSAVYGESGCGLFSTPGRNIGCMRASTRGCETNRRRQYCGVPDVRKGLSAPVPYAVCLCVGLGGLFAGVTGPLLSTFIPPLVQSALGDHRTAIGGVMAIDNVLLLLLVPWAGAASDRSSAAGRGRLPLIIGGLILSAIGMAL